MQNIEPDSFPVVHVAVGVVINAQKQVLNTLRHSKQHQGGLWEFPGGKVEIGETVLSALQREFQEEVGLLIRSAHPLIKVHHDYGDKKVLLDVWWVDEYSGLAEGLEGQSLRWTKVNQLEETAFPVANQAIVSMLKKLV